MYFAKFVFLSGCFSVLVSLGGAQSCKTRGEWCSDSELCCGGCCIQNVCVDVTYDDCSSLEDPCMDWYCPADAVCRMYRGCKGCELERKCIFLNPNNDVYFQMDPEVTRVRKSDGNSLMVQSEYLLFCLLLTSRYLI